MGSNGQMEDQLKDFIHFLFVEKGLAKNTIVSYERDLKSYIKYFGNVEQLKNVNEVERIHIIHFLGYLKEQGKSSRTYCFHKSISSIFIARASVRSRSFCPY